MPAQVPSMTAALGAEDYRQLYHMLMSGDPNIRTQAAELAKKLTPPEQHEFFDYQQQVHQGQGDRHREDNAILGVPPELAVTGAVGVGRAMVAPAVNMTGRAIAGAKAVVEQATPVVKYEATKLTLERMGVPTPLAVAAAIAVSGYRRGAKAEPSSAAASVPETVPAPSQPSAVSRPPSTPRPSPGPQLQLTEEESRVVRELVKQGYHREDVLADLQRHRAATTPESVASAAPPPVSGNPKLLAAEAKEYLRLIKTGKTHAEVMKLLEEQRAFVKRMKLPAAETARRSVVDRNATGHWPEE